MEKISVIVPVYNVEKYLPKCIESLMNQTYKNLEIILVDDGTKDNAGKMCDEYAKQDDRIKVIHKENGGLSDARNTGLVVASGEYIAFADSDDIVDRRAYEVLYDLINKYDAEISFCELSTIYENEFEKYPNINLKKQIIEDVIEKEYSVPEALSEMILNHNVGNYVPIKLFKKELFNGLKFETGVYYEDAAFTYKIVSKAKKIAYTNEKLYYYLVNREGAITGNFNEKKIIDSMNAYSTQYNFISTNYPEILEIVSYNWVRLYTSAMEKVLMNGFIDLYESEIVLQKYELFKNAYLNVSKEFLIEKLESYRLISATLLYEDRMLYKAMFETLYNNIKMK